MTEILNYPFNTGLGTWTSETDADGDLNWSNDATAQAVAATAGAVKFDLRNTNWLYLTRILAAPNTTGIMRCRLYLDPNTCPMTNGLDTEIFVVQGSAPTWGEVAIVKLGKTSGGSYCVKSFAQLDGNTYNSSGDRVITDAPHWVETEVRRSTGNNGRHRFWIDSLAAPIFDSGAVLDNDTKFDSMQYFYFGAFGGVPYSTPGSFYLDELRVNDDGAEIGPVSDNPPIGTPVLSVR